MTLTFADMSWRGMLQPRKPLGTFSGWDVERDVPVMEVDVMLVPESLRAEALSDKKDLNPAPCVMLRVNSAECMERRWFTYCRVIMSYSR